MITAEQKQRIWVIIGLLLVALISSGTNACQENYFFAAQSTASPTEAPSESDDDDDTTAVPTASESESETPTPDATVESFFRSQQLVEELAKVPSGNKLSVAKLGSNSVASSNSQRTKSENWLGKAYSDQEVEGSSLDSDADGFTDQLELDFDTDPFDQASTPPAPVTRLQDRLAGVDSDADGLTERQEEKLGTAVDFNDSDQDGVLDGAEILSKSDPLDAESKPFDRDGDGLSHEFEARIGTNPANPDTDSDGLRDDLEVALKVNPLSNDTDNDGILDGKEVALGSDPLIPEAS